MQAYPRGILDRLTSRTVPALLAGPVRRRSSRRPSGGRRIRRETDNLRAVRGQEEM
ncbi:MAG TPA: hypothetical protein VHR45_09275 [Thermoanaerobaculia bacterium]|nr:hypothetical protein [Thermoanaerobaculia bacterium]